MSVRNLGELGANLRLIAERLLANQNLCKLLYYTDKDPLAQPEIQDVKAKLLHKLILMIPLAGSKENAQSLIGMRVRAGILNANNEEYRDFLLEIEVLTPLTQWIMKSESLRPFLIMGEIQKSLKGKSVHGIGKLDGGDFELNYLTEDVSCYLMRFSITGYD